MPSVLVVDDELPFCRAVRSLVEEVDSRFTVVGEAYDGADALQQLEAKKPDVLITDIRMPMMNGLQLIEEAKRLRPELITIILSSYPDFEYTQSAIRLRTDDYLLKPIRIRDLETTLERTAQRWRERFRLRMKESFGEWLFEEAEEVPPLFASFAQFGAMYARAGGGCNSSMEAFHPGQWMWKQLEALLEEEGVGGLAYWIYDGTRINEKYIIVASESPDAQANVQQALRQVCERFVEAVRQAGSFLSVCIGEPKRSLPPVREELKLLSRALRRHAPYGDCKRLELSELTDPAAAPPILPDIDRHVAELLADHARTANGMAFAAMLERLLTSWRTYSPTQQQLETQLRQVSDVLRRTEFAGELELLQVDLETALSSSASYADMVREVCGRFADFVSTRRQAPETGGQPGRASSVHTEHVVKQIEQYIQEHYRQPITLEELSAQFGFVPNYVSAMFKRERGMTPGEYVTHWRIRQAIETMKRHPELLLKQVSEAVGYPDPYYFSRVFKKVTGVPPTEYSSRITR